MPKNKSFEFEATMKQLEKIVSTLESESESLEKSLTLFEDCLLYTSPSPRD